MAWDPPDDSVLVSDGAGALTVASVLTTSNSVSLSTGVRLPRRTNAAGAACAIGPTDFYVGISSNGGGAVVISETMSDGQLAVIEMTAFNTDAYTMVVGGGTLTFNAVDEKALIFHNGTEVIVLGLVGATIV